jgi:hypothetical protein
VQKLLARASSVSRKQLPFGKIGKSLEQLEAGVFF